jgi:hypothetical protein
LLMMAGVVALLVLVLLPLAAAALDEVVTVNPSACIANETDTRGGRTDRQTDIDKKRAACIEMDRQKEGEGRTDRRT